MLKHIARIGSINGKRALRAVLTFTVSALLVLAPFAPAANAASRLKDIAEFEGIRDNMLVGYGIVVGLNGTGDSLEDGHFTKQSLFSMLERLGVKPTADGLDSKNTAAVMVTATLPPFAKQGNRIDVTVSALGDSSSLLGGTLLVTPLIGADGEVYAVSQGNLAVGGFSAKTPNPSLKECRPVPASPTAASSNARSIFN